MKHRTWLAGFATLLLALPSLAVVKTYNADTDNSTKFPTDRRIYRGDCDANAPTPNAGDGFSDQCACTAGTNCAGGGAVPDAECTGSAGRPGGGLCNPAQATGLCSGGTSPGAVCTTAAGCPPTIAQGVCTGLGTCTGPAPGTCTGPGTCTAGLCVGGANPGAACVVSGQCLGLCVGGSNPGAVCSTGPTGNPAFAGGSHCKGTCVGGAAAGLLCASTAACGTCTGGVSPGVQCGGPGNPSPNPNNLCPSSADASCTQTCAQVGLPLYGSPKPPCNKTENGSIVIDDAGGAPTLQSMVLIGAFTDFVGGATVSGIPGTTVELHSTTTLGPAPNQTGVGSTSTSINWGQLTGWTQTGQLFCVTNCPGGCAGASSCKPFVGFEGLGPPAPLKASSFNTDPWTFTGDMHSFYTKSVELVSLGLGAVTAAGQFGGRLVQIPALPLAALGGLGAGLVYLGSRALSRKRN